MLPDSRFNHSLDSTTHAYVSTKVDRPVSLVDVLDEQGFVIFQDVLDVDDFIWLGQDADYVLS